MAFLYRLPLQDSGNGSSTNKLFLACILSNLNFNSFKFKLFISRIHFSYTYSNPRSAPFSTFTHPEVGTWGLPLGKEHIRSNDMFYSKNCSICAEYLILPYVSEQTFFFRLGLSDDNITSWLTNDKLDDQLKLVNDELDDDQQKFVWHRKIVFSPMSLKFIVTGSLKMAPLHLQTTQSTDNFNGLKIFAPSNCIKLERKTLTSLSLCNSIILFNLIVIVQFYH